MNRKGQIIVPSLFIFPTLFLFAILIFEVARLSQQKIVHQFAMDTSIFTELSNYSDLANRVAYINGAFPHRVFKEILRPEVRQVFLKNGAYAELQTDPPPPQGPWTFRFGPERDKLGWNSAIPPCEDGTGDCELVLITKKDASELGISRELAERLFKDYYHKVFGLLQSVIDGQVAVYNAINKKFFTKTFYLNTASIPEDIPTPKFTVRHHYTTKVSVGYCDVAEKEFYGITIPWVDCGYLTYSLADKPLLQLTRIPELSGPIRQTFHPKMEWDPPKNFFVDTAQIPLPSDAVGPSGRPMVRNTVEFSGLTASVWPNPTPLYQVLLKP